MRSGFLGGGIGPRAFGGGGLPDPVPVTTGAELLTNGDFSAWSGDNPVGWVVNGTEDANTYVTQHASGAQIVTAGNVIGITQYVLTPGNWYQATASVVSVSGFVGVLLGATYPGISYYSAGANAATGRASDISYQIKRGGGAANVIIASASGRLLTLASLFSTRVYAAADCDISAAITCANYTQAGVVARLDSAIAPANFIIAYLDRITSTVKVDKCVGGVYTNVISGVVTYAAGRVLRLVCSGNNVSCYYNGVQVGTTQTVSDAGIVSNTRHGKFSTYASNVLAGFVAA